MDSARRCEVCGSDISSKRKHARFCSVKCRSAPRFYGTHCLQCQAKIYVSPGKITSKSYCTPKCRFAHRNPNFNEDFFEEPNLINSYWAGFIAADGCVAHHSGSSLRLSFSLQASDKSHLMNFQSAVGAGKIYDDAEHNKCSFYLYSNKICKDLEDRFGITPRKTFTLRPPDLHGENALAYIAGLIDGDGSYTFNGTRPCLSLAGTKEILVWVNRTFEMNAKISPTDNIYCMAFYGDKAIIIRSRIQELKIPLLDRKKYRWESLGLDLTIKNRRRKMDNGKFASG